MNQETKAINAVKAEHHNTKKTKPTILTRESDFKKSPWLEDYEDLGSFRMQPVTQATLQKLGFELLKHAETTEEPLVLDWFFTKKRIDPRTARGWAKKYESFGRIYRVSKQILGMRREDGALKKKFDAGIVTMTMPMYNEEWKELMEWRESIRSQDDMNLKRPVSINFYDYQETPEKFLKKDIDKNLE